MGFNSYEFRLLRAKRHADKVKQDQIVSEVRHRNDGDRKKIQFSKLGLWLLFADGFFIQIFCMFLIYKYANDMNVSAMIGALLSLLGTILVQGLSYGFYAKKSSIENSQGGIVYQSMMNEYNTSLNVESHNTMSDEDEDSVG